MTNQDTQTLKLTSSEMFHIQTALVTEIIRSRRALKEGVNGKDKEYAQMSLAKWEALKAKVDKQLYEQYA